MDAPLRRRSVDRRPGRSGSTARRTPSSASCRRASGSSSGAASGELWVPAGWTAGDQDRGSNSFICIGRLKPGVTLDAGAQRDGHDRPRAGAASTPTDNAGRDRPRRGAMQRVRRRASCGRRSSAMLGGRRLRAADRLRERREPDARARGRAAARAGDPLRDRRRPRAHRAAAADRERAACAASAALRARARRLGHERCSCRCCPAACDACRCARWSGIDIDARVLAFTWPCRWSAACCSASRPRSRRFGSDLNKPLKNSRARSTGGGRSRLRYGLVAVRGRADAGGPGRRRRDDRERRAAARRRSRARPKNVLVMEMSLPQEDLYYGPPTHARFCADLDSSRWAACPACCRSAPSRICRLSGAARAAAFAIEGRPDPGPEQAARRRLQRRVPEHPPRRSASR